MTIKLTSGVAAISLIASGALAQDLLFAPGEGAFTWDSYVAFGEATDLAGQTVTITGPWTGNEAEKVNRIFKYFDRHGCDRELLRL